MRRFKEPLILSVGSNVLYPAYAILADFRLKMFDMTHCVMNPAAVRGAAEPALCCARLVLRKCQEPLLPRVCPACFLLFNSTTAFYLRPVCLLTNSDLTAP